MRHLLTGFEFSQDEYLDIINTAASMKKDPKAYADTLKGKAGAIIKGLLFVGGSMTSYAVGQKFGEATAKRVKANVKLVKN